MSREDNSLEIFINGENDTIYTSDESTQFNDVVSMFKFYIGRDFVGSSTTLTLWELRFYGIDLDLSTISK